MTVGGVAEVYGFSNLKGLGTCALAVLFMSIPLILLLLLVAVISLMGMMAI